ncbi:GNAT family N-acetyltransferase [Niallia sp. FSL W8-0635]|uniref:GNAT family N-acetyltransferase n=1 Tax=Niallia sp. FSL W8-0635 TaxID=2975337 RepID=UPI0009C72B3B|nr:Predicted acetyltransferase [Mycobacteroides abscessus subsp. abscessus]HEO8418313.1 GNAT family N-acetyltransferase [Yersinia enterocolitica]
MIRELTENDHSIVMEFLLQDPSINLFIIGDIEAFGYDASFQKLWGEFHEGHITAVLLKYFESYIFYCKDKNLFDVEGFASIMQTTTNPVSLSGRADFVEKFENLPNLTLGKKKVTYFAQCGTNKDIEITETIKEATIADIDRIVVLRDSIDEFITTAQTKNILKKAIESKTGRTYYLENDKQEIISTVSTTAENSQSAMIVGVCTHKDYRNNGYASKLMTALVKDVLKEKQYVCLFYDNPDAGKIYKKVGFKDIGLWTMYR